MKLKTILQLFGGFTVLVTLFRFVSLDYWWVRVFDFPHIQLTILSIIAFFAYFIKFDFKIRNDYIFSTVLLLCMAYHISRIYIYTPLAPLEAMNSSEDSKKSISVFTANVLQENKEKSLLVSEIDKFNPNIVLLTETNNDWIKYVSNNISEEYKYSIKKPMDNTYGMVLYSKNKLIDSQIKFLVEENIPSIHTKVLLDDNTIFQLYCIHPTPPMPQHNPKSSDRDSEMMQTAILSMQSKLPTIVLGDFNDVAWSQTTILFQNVSGLLDPRQGRGLYNSYDANNFLLRWPLDHIFISPEFRVKSFEKGEHINSDHFPIYLELSFEPEIAKEQTPDPASKEDLDKAKEQIKGSALSKTKIY